MSITWRTKAALTQSHFLEQNSYFLNTLRAPYFLHAHTRGLWLYGGTLFSLFLFLSLTHPCFPSHHLPWTGAQENTVPTVPDLQTPDAEDERVGAEKHARLLGCAEQIICTTGLCPAAPLTHPLSLPPSLLPTLVSWASAGQSTPDFDSTEYFLCVCACLLRKSGLVASHCLFQMCGAICQ